MAVTVNAGRVTEASANFTRPNDTTAYASGDLVANSATAGSVVALTFANINRFNAGGGKLVGVKLRKSGTSITNAQFRLHLFRAAPETVTNGDNGALSVSGVADYVGAFDITIDRAFTDGAFGRSAVPLSGNFLDFVASARSLYGLLEARAAYTPAAQEVFTATLVSLPD